MEITKKQAIDLLDRLDEADDHGKTIWVTGGVAKLIETKELMDSLSRADRGAEDISVNKEHYELVVSKLEQWETSVSSS